MEEDIISQIRSKEIEMRKLIDDVKADCKKKLNEKIAELEAYVNEQKMKMVDELEKRYQEKVNEILVEIKDKEEKELRELENRISQARKKCEVAVKFVLNHLKELIER